MTSQTVSRRWRLIAAVLAVGLLIGACGDDASSDSSASTTSDEHGDHDESAPSTTTDRGAEEHDDGHGESGGEHEDGDTAIGAADATIDVTVNGGSVSGDTGRQEVAVGDVVLVTVTSDMADEVHVHGYDHLTDVDAGETAEIGFTADIPGVFEIELESSGLLLAELAVS